MMNLDQLLWYGGVPLEILFVIVLVFRRIWRRFPLFFVYCIWDTASSILAIFILHSYRSAYTDFYLLEAVVSSALEFCVIVELSWSLLRPIRASLPRRTPVVIALVVLAVGAVVWPFSTLRAFAATGFAIREIMHLQQTTSILRVVLFLALAGGSQMLSLSWRDRELQIATGLGFYSLVGLGISILQTHRSTVVQYSQLNLILVASYLCSLLYWVYSFAQKEAERREFTPQMQTALLAMAGVAREQRLALAQTAMERRKSKF
jgi:hypothetical protein